jgi:hypothetical protein
VEQSGKRKNKVESSVKKGWKKEHEEKRKINNAKINRKINSKKMI